MVNFEKLKSLLEAIDAEDKAVFTDRRTAKIGLSIIDELIHLYKNIQKEFNLESGYFECDIEGIKSISYSKVLDITDIYLFCKSMYETLEDVYNFDIASLNWLIEKCTNFDNRIYFVKYFDEMKRYYHF